MFVSGTHCLTLFPQICACVGWCVACPRSCVLLSAIVLSQFVSYLVSQLVPLHVSLSGVVSFCILLCKQCIFSGSEFLMLSDVFV